MLLLTNTKPLKTEKDMERLLLELLNKRMFDEYHAIDENTYHMINQEISHLYI